MATEKHRHARLIHDIEDAAWGKLGALAHLKGQTIGDYLADLVIREWERETGQKATEESGEAKS